MEQIRKFREVPLGKPTDALVNAGHAVIVATSGFKVGVERAIPILQKVVILSGAVDSEKIMNRHLKAMRRTKFGMLGLAAGGLAFGGGAALFVATIGKEDWESMNQNLQPLLNPLLRIN